MSVSHSLRWAVQGVVRSGCRGISTARIHCARPSSPLRSQPTVDVDQGNEIPESTPLLQSTRGVTEVKPFSHFLTDTFGREHDYLRISISERCNLRCRYCMPEEGVTLTPDDTLMSLDEVVQLASVFVAQGVKKIRLTGGEPLVRKGVVDLVANLKALPGLETVAMTTNGLTLPRMLPKLVDAGLTHLNVSLDSLHDFKFEIITRRKGFDRVRKGIDLAVELGMPSVKINCVVMKGFNDDELCDFVELTREKNIDVRFIEYMPFDGNKWSEGRFFSYDDMVSTIRERFPDIAPIDDGRNETSKPWAVPGFAGRVGFITSMSNHFCGSCNRLRLTADGNLKVCLFGNAEVNLVEQLSGTQKGTACRDDQPLQDEEPSHDIDWGVKSPNGFRQTAFRGCRGAVTPSWPFVQHGGWSSVGRVRNLHSNASGGADTGLTHVDDSGKASMVDVGDKPTTTRTAVASGLVLLGETAFGLVQKNGLKKGDVLTVAEIAGIMGAKQCSTLIPLCHPVALTKVDVSLVLLESENAIRIVAEATAVGQTGVEMEALSAVTVAALTCYDMCKAVTHDIEVTDIRLESKTGGQRGDYSRTDEPHHASQSTYLGRPTYTRQSPH